MLTSYTDAVNTLIWKHEKKRTYPPEMHKSLIGTRITCSIGVTYIMARRYTFLKKLRKKEK